MAIQEEIQITQERSTRPLIKAMTITVLLIVSTVVALLIDSEALTASAYHWPFMLWRVATYGLFIYKVKPRYYSTMFFCIGLNELAIYAHWAGGQYDI